MSGKYQFGATCRFRCLIVVFKFLLNATVHSIQNAQYYLTRQGINHANILVFNYQYMLDPKVAKMVSKELEAESIVVFDEAHNIDSVCIEALSVTVNDRGLDQATRSLGRLSSEVSRLKASDSQRLQNEYQNLVNGLIDQGLLDAPANDAGLGSVRFGLGISMWMVHVELVV